jgi:hypothetical protein
VRRVLMEECRWLWKECSGEVFDSVWGYALVIYGPDVRSEYTCVCFLSGSLNFTRDDQRVRGWHVKGTRFQGRTPENATFGTSHEKSVLRQPLRSSIIYFASILLQTQTPISLMQVLSHLMYTGCSNDHVFISSTTRKTEAGMDIVHFFTHTCPTSDSMG